MTTHRPARRRGFNLIEMLIALAITATLMAATMVALDASFMAYQSTTEVASTHTIGRLAMHRMLTLIRTGIDFGPYPINPQDSIVESAEIEILTPDDPPNLIRIEWIETADAAHPVENALYVSYNSQPPQMLIGGVMPQLDAGGQPVMPFTLEYELGRQLYRATIDITIMPDDNVSTTLDGDNQEQIRLVASAMPRMAAYQD